jgi:arylformamidase
MAKAGDALLNPDGMERQVHRSGLLPNIPISLLRPRRGWSSADSGFRILGVDAVTPELPGHLPTPSYPCPVHHTLPGNGVLILENLVLSEVAGTRFPCSWAR